MIFALVGNQNCGKTTLFNQLTGSNQHVGNFPGVTVDSKEGVMRGAKGCSVVDLPAPTKQASRWEPSPTRSTTPTSSSPARSTRCARP